MDTWLCLDRKIEVLEIKTSINILIRRYIKNQEDLLQRSGTLKYRETIPYMTREIDFTVKGEDMYEYKMLGLIYHGWDIMEGRGCNGPVYRIKGSKSIWKIILTIRPWKCKIIIHGEHGNFVLHKLLSWSSFNINIILWFWSFRNTGFTHHLIDFISSDGYYKRLITNTPT